MANLTNFLNNTGTQQVEWMMSMAGYKPLSKISDTIQGEIWRASQIMSNLPVVIKATNINLHSKSIMMDHCGNVYRIEEDILREITILKYLSNDKQSTQLITKYHDSFQSNTHFYLVMADGGFSVFSFVSRAHQLIKAGELDISEWHRVVKIVFKQMIECIDYIHSKNVCHFDISLENFLINDIPIDVIESQNGAKKVRFAVDSSGKGIQIKLCDFGLSQYFDSNITTKQDEDTKEGESSSVSFMSNRYCGKTNYQSPEITNKQKKFNAKSNDIWCLGVCLFMMIIGNSPWHSSSDSDARFKTIMNGNLLYLLKEWNKWDYVNHDIYELFESFFQFEHKRINMQQLRKCKWLNEGRQSLQAFV